MKKYLFILLGVLESFAYATAPVITPSIPVVYVSSNITFTADQSVTWVLVGTGTLSGATATKVTYTGPGNMTPRNDLHGCSVSPLDQIWNTNISSYAVITSSTNYMRTNAGSNALSFEVDMPINVYNGNETAYPMHFNYTPTNDANFKIAAPYKLRMENGIFSDKDADKDTHVLAIDTQTCTASELYKLYPVGTQSDCLTCTSQSGVTYTDRYPIVQGTTAGGLPITSLLLKYRELRECADSNGAKPIRHAGRITMSIGLLAPSKRWPAVAFATDGGLIPFGSYMRLVSTYPVTGSAAAQCILQSYKDYGLIVDDGGTNGHIQIAQDASADYDLFFALTNELPGVSAFKMQNLEVIDVTPARDTNSASPTFDTGRASTPTAYGYAVVYATNASNQTSFMPIIVQPVTIGTEREVGYSFMAGTPQYPIPIWVKGSTDTTFSCSMSPTIGSLTSGGLYTPPSVVIGRSSTTATCTATVDPNAKISFPLINFSSDSIRVRLQNANNSNYGPDVNGKTWYAEKGAFWRLQGHANCDWSSETWTGVTDQDLYQECQYVNDGSGDMLHRFIVPNGDYDIYLHFAVGDPFALDTWVFGIDSQNTIYSGSSASTIAGNGAWTFFGLTGKKVDLCNIIGACTSDLPGTVHLQRTVTDNNLYFGVRHLVINGDTSRPSLLNAYQVTLSTLAAGGGGGGGGGGSSTTYRQSLGKGTSFGRGTRF